MKLLTQEIAQRFPPIYATEDLPEEQKPIVAKFFSPVGAATWYAVEADALIDAEDERWTPLHVAVASRIAYSDVKFFGYVTGLSQGEGEWGYFLLSELESARLPLGLRIERDLYFGHDKTFGDVLSGRAR